MKLTPLSDRVVLKMTEAEETTKGGYDRFPHLARCSTAKDIIISSKKKDITTCLDGECITTDYVHIRLADKKLNFFGPEGCDCNATARSAAPAGAEM